MIPIGTRSKSSDIFHNMKKLILRIKRMLTLFPGNVYHFNATEDTFDRITVIPPDDYLQFSVAACQLAKVLLMSVPGDPSEPAYEVVIRSGANEKTELISVIEVRPIYYFAKCIYMYVILKKNF